MNRKLPWLAGTVASLLFLLSLLPSGVHATSNNTAEDNFTRANQQGWGTTTNNDGLSNYAWQRSLATGQSYSSIQSNAGIVIYAGTNGHKVAGYVPVPANAGGDILEEFVFTHVGEGVAGACLNVAGGTSWYQVDANTDLSTLEIRKRLSGTMTTETSISMSYSANQAYWLREDVQVSGGVATVQARLWADGFTEPTNWQVSWLDSSPLANGQAGAMGDWFKAPPLGTQLQFFNWSYAASGLASPAQ